MFYADRVGLAAVLDRIRGVPPRARRALAAGAAAGRAGRQRPDVPRAGSDEETLTCRPPSRDALRTPRMLPPDAIVSRDDRGRLRVRSPHALGPYPATLTALPGAVGGARARPHLPRRAAPRRRLGAPDLPGRVRAHARGRAGAARSRPVGRSADRHPVGQRPRARRARRSPRCTSACRTRRSRRPTRCSSQDHRTLAARLRGDAPGPGLRGRGRALRARAGQPGAAGRRRGRHRAARRRACAGRRRFAALARRHGDRGGGRRARARRARHRRQDALHVGVDRRAEGRDQHAAHALRQPGAAADGAGVPRRRAAGALRLAAVEPHLRRQPQLRPRRSTTAARSTSTPARRRRPGSRRPRPTCARSRPPPTSTCRGATTCCCRRCAATPISASRFFSRLQILFYAAAGLRQEVSDGIDRLAVEACGERVPWVTGLGATETAPFALCTGRDARAGQRTRRRAGARRRAEARAGRRAARGARPRAERHARLLARSGAHRAPRSTTTASTRWATRSAASIRPIPRAGSRSRGARRGLQALDRHVGAGRAAARGAARRARRAGAGRRRSPAPERDDVRGARLPEPRRVPPPRRRCRRTRRSATCSTARPSCARVRGRAVGLQRGAGRQLDARRRARCCWRSRRRSTRGEITDKGSINQKAVLRRRAALVDALYGAGRHRRVFIDVARKDDDGVTSSRRRSRRGDLDRHRRARAPRGARRRHRPPTSRRASTSARAARARDRARPGRVLPVAPDGVRRVLGGRAAVGAAAALERRGRRLRRGERRRRDGLRQHRSAPRRRRRRRGAAPGLGRPRPRAQAASAAPAVRAERSPGLPALRGVRRGAGCRCCSTPGTAASAPACRAAAASA